MARHYRYALITCGALCLAATIAYLAPIHVHDLIPTDTLAWLTPTLLVGTLVLPVLAFLGRPSAERRPPTSYPLSRITGLSALRSFQSAMLRDVPLVGRGSVAYS